GEGSGTPTEPHHIPSPEVQSPSHTTHTSPTLPPVTTTSLPTVTQSDTPIIKTWQPSISPPCCLMIQHHVTSPVADEGSMQQTIPKLTALCTSLQRQLSELTAKFQAQEVETNRLKERVKMLEDSEGVAATRSRDDAPIKGRSMDEGEAATERISDDSEEMVTVLTSMDAATVLASRVVDVPTGSGSIPTTSNPAEEIAPLFDTMLVQQGEGLGTPTESHHTPSPKAQSPSHTTHTSPTLPPVTTTSLPNVTQSDTPIVRQYTRRTKIAQSSVLLTVADEPASPLRDISQGEACPTDSGFIADQNRATIDKSSTLPYDSAPRLLPLLLMRAEVEINRFKERVKMLEDREGVVAIRSGDDAPIKGRSMDKGEAATERISDDSEEMVTVLTSMDAATVLASRVVDAPTGSGSIPTASTPAEEQVPTGSDVVPTASPVFATATVVTPYISRKGKEVMVESETPKKQKQLEREDQRRSEQIARDAEIVRIHAEEELHIMIDGLDRNNETVAKYLNNLGIEDFIPMGSKEEAERIKRKGLNLEQESAKKQKTSKEVPEEAMSHEEVPKKKETLINRPPTSDKEMELWVELSRLYEPDNEDQLWTHTQNFMHVPVEWKLYDTRRVHHVTSKDKEIFMLVKKDYPLRKGLALVMISYKLQVENYSQMANDLILKIYKIANSPRQHGD
nr:hypothetical protein [Tanacetum cinerariifolium]